MPELTKIVRNVLIFQTTHFWCQRSRRGNLHGQCKIIRNRKETSCRKYWSSLLTKSNTNYYQPFLVPHTIHLIPRPSRLIKCFPDKFNLWYFSLLVPLQYWMCVEPYNYHHLAKYQDLCVQISAAAGIWFSDRRADVFSMVLKLQDYKERVVFWSNLKSVSLPVAQLANFVRV